MAARLAARDRRSDSWSHGRRCSCGSVVSGCQCSASRGSLRTCADSTKSLATLGDSDGENCRDRDGNTFPASTVPAVASEMGKPHFVDRLLKPLPCGACGGLCPSSPWCSGRGTTARYQASGDPALRRSSRCDGRHSSLEGQPIERAPTIGRRRVTGRAAICSIAAPHLCSIDQYD